ncbi:MAG: hypothetical protein Q7S84_03435 [bacterium]|nr:hypothetical protein [bacterium]
MENFKRQLTIHVVITVVLVGALTAGLIVAGKRINSSTTEIQGLRQELVTRWSSLFMLADLLTSYNARAEQGLTVLKRVIPQRDALLNLGRDIRSLAVKSNIEQTYTFISESPADTGSLGYVTFQLALTGSYDDLRSYIQSLDTFMYLSRFDAVQFDRSTSKSSATVKGRVFFQ